MTTNNHSNNITALHQAMFNIANDAWNINDISDEQFLEISTALGKVWALSLPQHADNGAGETNSPESRNRLEDNQPTTMGTTNNKENNMNIEEALQVLVTHITEQVTEAVESAIEDAISDALENYDPSQHCDFEDNVRGALSGMSITLSGEVD